VALAASQAHRGREGPLPGAASQAPGLEVGQEDPEAGGKAKGVVVMARRATRGTGTVFFSKERRRWMAQLTVGHDPKTGRPKKLTRSFPTKREAEAWRQEMALKHFRGLLAPPEAITVRDFAQSWLERKAREVRPRTLFLYRKELAYALPSLEDPQAKDPLGRARLQAVNPRDIRAVIDGLLNRGLSLRTVKKVREKLNAIFEEALALELVARNPVAPVKVRGGLEQEREKPGRTLETWEIEALLAALDAHPDPRTALVLRLCLSCGLRKGEALGLQWEDIDLEKGLLYVRRTWSFDGARTAISDPKTASGRRAVPIPSKTLARLEGYREWWRERLGSYPPPSFWVFPGVNGQEPLGYNTPNRALTRILKRLGLPPARVHDLRHTYGSMLLARGAPVELVSERMGHTSPSITFNNYRHMFSEERQAHIFDPEDFVAASGGGKRPEVYVFDPEDYLGPRGQA